MLYRNKNEYIRQFEYILLPNSRTEYKHNIAFINRICIIMSKFAFMRMLGRITTPNKQSPACVTVWDLKNLCKVFQKMIAFNQKFFL